MTDHATAAPAAATGRLAQARKRLGGLRLAYLPVLMTYFCYGASGVTGVARGACRAPGRLCRNSRGFRRTGVVGRGLATITG